MWILNHRDWTKIVLFWIWTIVLLHPNHLLSHIIISRNANVYTFFVLYHITIGFIFFCRYFTKCDYWLCIIRLVLVFCFMTAHALRRMRTRACCHNFFSGSCIVNTQTIRIYMHTCTQPNVYSLSLFFAYHPGKCSDQGKAILTFNWMKYEKRNENTAHIMPLKAENMEKTYITEE